MPRLCVIPGDGIGQEVTPAAVRVLQAALPDLQIVPAVAGWDCFQATGTAVPAATLASVRECGAALFGAVSSPSQPVAGYRSAILTLRQELGLYANIRPVRSLPRVSPRADVDLIVVRENSEGLYAGRERRQDGVAVAERVITATASHRLAVKVVALCRALGRRRVTVVHKANVLPLSDGLFRDTVREVMAGPEAAGELQVDELLADVAGLKLVAAPEQYDVIVTTNLFGDILSDAAAHWGGGLGYAASLNWGDDLALAEPVHGSAPDIAGQNVASPVAAILSAALLARFAWRDEAVAQRIEAAVAAVLASGRPPADTEGVTRAIISHL